jgi:serine/threonine protein kinase
MPVPTAAEMLDFLEEHGFLPPELPPLAGTDGAAVFADAHSLARALVDRDLLTPYQANQFLQGRGGELLLGPYRILDRLGEGGMGQVFQAHHVCMDRIIALKVIAKDRVSDPTAVARFYREVRAVAKLSHPNIVTAFEVNQVGDTHFLAMEYVGGIDLARLVRQSGPLSIPNACEYIRQAAVGLQHAHEKGLVHRDIKPGNLIVARPNPEEPPITKILDFGLARFESESAQAERLTQLGKIVGTVDYIAPEQAQNARTADIRADIFSLGCSLFFLLTGQPPFVGKDAAEKIGARVLGDAPSVREVRPEVSPALEQVVAKMMARNPADRYHTPGEVAKALEPHTQQERQPPGKPIPTQERPIARTRKPSAAPAKVKTDIDGLHFWSQGPGARRPLLVIVAMAFVAGSLMALIAVGAIVFWLGTRDGPAQSGRQANLKTSGSDGPSSPTKTQSKSQTASGSDKKPPVTESKKSNLDPKQPETRKEEVQPPTKPLPKKHVVGEIHRFDGHAAGVVDVAFAPNGLTAVSGGDDRTVFLWDVESGKEIRRFEGHGGAINCVCFTPDGLQVISGSADKTLRLWEVATGKEIRRFKHAAAVGYGIVVTPNGSRIICHSADKIVHIWDLERGTKLRQFEYRGGLDPKVIDVWIHSFSSDGQLAISVATDKIVRLWHVDKATVQLLDRDVNDAKVPVQDRASTGGTLSADGRFALTWHQDIKHLLLYDVASGKLLHRFEQPAPVYRAFFSPDGKRVVASYDGQKFAGLWDVATGNEVYRIAGNPLGIPTIRFSPDGKHALSSGRDGTVRFWGLPD